jgi:hypothetical protein
LGFVGRPVDVARPYAMPGSSDLDSQALRLQQQSARSGQRVTLRHREVPSQLPISQDWSMSLDWVGSLATAGVGAVGVFFTWLTGKQARSQALEMATLSFKAAERQRLRDEQREAYFSVLRLAHINSYRRKYERRGDTVRLQQVDERWPRTERMRMLVEADTALSVYGSEDAQQTVAEWTALDEPHDDGAYERFYERFLGICRRDLDVANKILEPKTTPPATSPSSPSRPLS